MAFLLVAEDDDDIRDAICSLLGDEGHELACVGDVAAARAAFVLRRPDVAIVDLQLRGEKSLCLLDAWTRATKVPPIILISASRADAREAGMKYGTFVLEKPFAATMLMDTVSVALRHMTAGVFL